MADTHRPSLREATIYDPPALVRHSAGGGDAVMAVKRPYKRIQIAGRSRLVDLPTYLDVQKHPDQRLFRTCVHLKTMSESCVKCESAE